MSNADELQAGRELDDLIAERVMGWTAPDGISWRDENGVRQVQNFSTRISAAWRVVTRVRKSKTAAFSLECLSPTDDYWQATFKGDLNMEKACYGWLETAHADTECLAVCRAALKVTQVRREKSIPGLPHAVFSGEASEDGDPIYNVPFPTHKEE